jgi:hypothetical protein
MTAQFINTLCSATLEESNMRWEDIEQLCAAEPDPLLDVTDKHFVKALRTFLLTTNSLQATYNAIRSTMLVCYPDDPFLSFDQMKRHVKQLSGVVLSFMTCAKILVLDSLVHFRIVINVLTVANHVIDLVQKNPTRQFVSIPLGSVIQALYGSLETARKCTTVSGQQLTFWSMLGHTVGASGNTAILPTVRIIWMQLKLGKSRRMTFSCNSPLMVLSSIRTRNRTVGSLCMSFTILLPTCITRRGSSSLLGSSLARQNQRTYRLIPFCDTISHFCAPKGRLTDLGHLDTKAHTTLNSVYFCHS